MEQAQWEKGHKQVEAGDFVLQTSGHFLVQQADAVPVEAWDHAAVEEAGCLAEGMAGSGLGQQEIRLLPHP